MCFYHMGGELALRVWFLRFCLPWTQLLPQLLGKWIRKGARDGPESKSLLSLGSCKEWEDPQPRAPLIGPQDEEHSVGDNSPSSWCWQ